MAPHCDARARALAMSTDHEVELLASTRAVEATSLRFTPAVVAAVIVVVIGWTGTYFSIRSDIGSKASTVTVDKLTQQVQTNTGVLDTLRQRQLRMYCVQFPQSFECPAQEP